MFTAKTRSRLLIGLLPLLIVWLALSPCLTAAASEYPMENRLEAVGMQYCDAVIFRDGQGATVTERRPRQDGLYGLYNYFGLNDLLCRALYGEETDQIGTGERAADGDSLLVLAGVPLFQEAWQDGEEKNRYIQERNGLAVAVRSYLNSVPWQELSQLERARHAALYLATTCVYDMDLYKRFEAGENTANDPSFTAYGCLVGRKAVCEGISISFQLLTRAMGLNAFCAPDDLDKNHMFVLVQADGNWYKVDLSTTGLAPQTLVNRCFRKTVNQQAERMLTAYELYMSGGPGEDGARNFGLLAPGQVYDLTELPSRRRMTGF